MTNTNSAFSKLDEVGRKLEAVAHAQSMLSVDEAVMMPTGGGEKRADAMSVLAGLYHEMATHRRSATCSTRLRANRSTRRSRPQSASSAAFTPT